MSSALEELNKFVRDRTGWNMSHNELGRLYSRYLDERTQTVDLACLVEDLRRAMLLNQGCAHLLGGTLTATQRPNTARTSDNANNNNSSATYEQVIGVLSQQLVSRINLQSGHENKMRKAYTLLGESRSNAVTRAQLRLALQSRLSLSLRDSEIDTLFERLDPDRKGEIPLRVLVDQVLKKEREYESLSLMVGDRERDRLRERETRSPRTPSRPLSQSFRSEDVSNNSNLINNSINNNTANNGVNSPRPQSSRNRDRERDREREEGPTVSYDGRILNLRAPAPSLCRPYSVEDVENFLWERVFERSSLQDNMVKTLVRLFSFHEIQSNNNGSNNPNNDNANNSKTRSITLDQVRFTLWSRLKMNISDEDVVRFFNKYAQRGKQQQQRSGNNNGSGDREIDVFDLVQGIIRERSVSRPLLEDRLQGGAGGDRQDRTRISSDTAMKNPLLEDFLVLIRKQLNELANRESRAPHYLLHHNDRMTMDQAKSFFKHKLLIDIDAFPRGLKDLLCAEYLIHGLLDIKRLLVEAMAITEERVRKVSQRMQSNKDNAVNELRMSLNGTESLSEKKKMTTTNNNSNENSSNSGNNNNKSNKAAEEEAAVGFFAHQTLANGALVAVNRMPATLQGVRFSPSQIEEMIVQKCEERLTTDHPHASLFKLFREGDSGKNNYNNSYNDGISSHSNGNGNSNAAVISRAGMKQVLLKFDIIPSPEEFDSFFRKHDRGDGKIDVHCFLHAIMPPAHIDGNPFTPKDPAVMRKEQSLAVAIEGLTGRRREVSSLNGPSHTRVESEFLQELATETPPRSATHTQREREPVLVVGYGAVPQKSFSLSTAGASSPDPLPPQSPSLATRPSMCSPAGARRQQRPLTAGAPGTSSVTLAPPQNNESTALYSVLSPAPVHSHNNDNRNGTNHTVNSDGNNSNNNNANKSDTHNSAHKIPRVQTESASSSAVAAAQEKKILAESLVHALRDLSSLPLSPQGMKTATITRPVSARPTYRQSHAATSSLHSPRTGSKNQESNPAISARGEPQQHIKKNNKAMRPKSAQAALRSSSAHSTAALKDEDDAEYRLQQSQNLFALAQAYANSLKIETPNEDRTEGFTPKPRSSSAPPTRMRFAESLQLFNTLDTGMKPAVTPDTHTPRSFRDTSPRGDRRFTNTGQRKKAEVDPNKEALRNMYRFSKENCVTSHQEYGLFVKNWEKAIKQRQSLYDKQQHELHISGRKM